MKKTVILLSALAFSLSGCEVVGGIFKAGMVWGIILVLLVIFGIIYLINKGRGGSNNP
ncbi:MAG: hypothetical protein K0Q95_887 [Bacteroidota bacterium]|jgi:hypothetical protein|nr:hypothetical protein [Bacteroidota bacterium]